MRAGDVVVSTFALAFLAVTSASAQDRCQSVPDGKLQDIKSGLTVDGEGSISDGAAVRSDAFERLYFIAAEIDGPGLEGSGDIGVWASNRLEGGQGLLMSVSEIAVEFSVFRDGGKTDARVEMADDGAHEAAQCLRG